jgi:methylated-DNA-[protein]-cysteine S-methyltransferase
MSTANAATIETPAGPFTAIETGGTVLASGWTADIDDLIGLIHPTLRPGDVQRRPDLGDITKAITAYQEGDVAVIDTVPVKQVSGPFLSLAWDALRTVKAGEPVTYTQYAVVAGRPGAIRAAANACARNAAALFVPCHRVLRTDGTLGGFRWGLPTKRWLLDHEEAHTANG